MNMRVYRAVLEREQALREELNERLIGSMGVDTVVGWGGHIWRQRSDG